MRAEVGYYVDDEAADAELAMMGGARSGNRICH
jgi:hypothetical protein